MASQDQDKPWHLEAFIPTKQLLETTKLLWHFQVYTCMIHTAGFFHGTNIYKI